uniref:receptor protein serine/threonine kinase n=1 Tax=Heterorhabditis bacteriophora TaxID=37862 RepID=A0A1I7X890_HETBA
MVSLQCNSWRSPHRSPMSIACCYEGNYCNLNITPPAYANLMEDYAVIESLDKNNGDKSVQSRGSYAIQSRNMVIPITLGIISLIIVALTYVILYNAQSIWMLVTCNSTTTKKNTEDAEVASMLIDDLGKVIYIYIYIYKFITYGEVRKAKYRGSYVAVKTFYTTDEESWKNERDIYQTHMLNHENILQYVAADISSEDSITQMLLITDYHQLGSLYDYLRTVQTLTTIEALYLAHR